MTAARVEPRIGLADLAKLVGLSRRTLLNYTRLPHNPLPCLRMPGKVLVSVPEFNRWIETFRAQPVAPDLDAMVADTMRGLR